jgi:hypothetical protein
VFEHSCAVFKGWLIVKKLNWLLCLFKGDMGQYTPEDGTGVLEHVGVAIL